jgi:hypothetical protein
MSVRYNGRPRDSGELIATRLAFARPKLHGSKRNPASVAQVTTFPPGSIVDFDGPSTQIGQRKSLRTRPAAHVAGIR